MKKCRLWIVCIGVVLMLLCLCGALAEPAVIASGDCGDQVTWTLDDQGLLTISGTGVMTDYAAIARDGRMRAPWYDYRTKIQTVTIESGVQSVGAYAFRNCKNLVSITVPDSVTAVGENAFYACKNLAGIELSAVESIGASAFENCVGLLDVNLPAKMNTIDNRAFYGCARLESVAMPDALEYLGYTVFYGCSSLKAISVPEGIEGTGGALFNGCTSLTEVSLPSSLKWFWADDFDGCSSLSEIIIPEGVERVSGSFYGCSNLQRIVIPNSAVRISDFSWYECPKLTSVSGGSKDADCEVIDNVLYDKQEHALLRAVPNIESCVIPDGITRIGTDAFADCTRLKNVEIPDSVISIESGAFLNCTGLTSIVIPDGVLNLGDEEGCSVFSGCSNLKSIVIPESVTRIGSLTFEQCTGLTSIEIPDGVVYIGDRAFSSCRSLTSIAIPDSVTYIGEAAFYECSGLKSVVIPDGISSIADEAFSECYNLSNIVIPEGVTRIGRNAFVNCRSLTSVVIPDSVTEIGDGAFYNCTSLKSIEIPDSVISIGGEAFPTTTLIYCYRDSYAETWAIDNVREAKLRYIDDLPENQPGMIVLDESIYVGVGSAKALNPEIAPSGRYNITWTSDHPEIVSVSKDGVITGVAKGSANITASCGDVNATVQVTCIKLAESIRFETEEQLVHAMDDSSIEYTISARIEPADSDEPVIFKMVSGDEEKLNTWHTDCFSTDGTMRRWLNPERRYVITATTVEGDLTATCVLRIYRPVRIIRFADPVVSVEAGSPKQITARVSTEGDTTLINRLVHFTSSDPAVAMVSDDGVVTGVSVGTATITAAAESGVTATCTVNVSDHVHTIVSFERVDATCTADGRQAGTMCSVCNAIITGGEAIPAFGHTETEMEALAPTCTTDGHTTGTQCANCGAILAGDVLPAAGHSAVEDAYLAPTCTTDGHASGTHCVVCSAILSGNEAIPATGHTAAEDAYLAPTCTTDGHTAGTHCTICNAILSGNELLPAAGHKTVIDPYIAPTLTTSGCTEGSHCTACGEVFGDVWIIPQLTDAKIVSIPAAVREIAEETYVSTGVVCVTISNGCESIAARAFADCAQLALIRIPESVSSIADDAFENSTNVVIITTSGSAAQRYAEDHGITYLIQF